MNVPAVDAAAVEEIRMETSIEVGFGEGMRVSAKVGEHMVVTDQSVKHGGAGSAPTPFDLFLASLATCAGVFAKRFCEKHGLSVEGLGIRVTCEWHEKEYRVTKMTTALTLPAGFPEKYREALQRTVAQCAVKKQVLTPPEFVVEVE